MTRTMAEIVAHSTKMNLANMKMLHLGFDNYLLMIIIPLIFSFYFEGFSAASQFLQEAIWKRVMLNGNLYHYRRTEHQIQTDSCDVM